MDIASLDIETRKLLAQAACVAAWSDTSVVEEETDIVLLICDELELGDRETEQVQRWLKHGPPELDPFSIDPKHREVFLDTVKRVIDSDGRVDPMESETFQLLKELLGG